MMATPTRAPSRRAPLDRRLISPRPRPAEDARAYRVADGFWSLRLPLPYPRTSAVNCYLLATGSGYTLVDCGSAVGTGWEALTRGLELAGVPAHAITRLVLTHLHADHASLAGDLVQRVGCALARHAGPETASDRLREPRIAVEARRRAARAEGVPPEDLEDIVDAPLVGDGVQPMPDADAVLEAGDVVRTDAGAWEVVPAPGHSPQQMALFEPASRTLISADLAYPDIRPFLEWGHTPDPLAEYLDTLDRADALGAVLVLPGHGRPDPRPGDRFASARAAAQALVARVEQALGDEPASGYDVACRISGHDPDPDLRQSWLSCSLCVLDHLAGRGELVADAGSDGVRRFARRPA